MTYSDEIDERSNSCPKQTENSLFDDIFYRKRINNSHRHSYIVNSAHSLLLILTNHANTSHSTNYMLRDRSN